MKKYLIPISIFVTITVCCKKQSTSTVHGGMRPTAMLVSTDAILLDTVWSAPKRYIHFKITFDVITGDDNIFFTQLPADYYRVIRFLGADTVHVYTPYRPSVIPDVPELEPEGDVFMVAAKDTVRITYFGMIIAHGSWTQFYMQAYGFPYSSGYNDGIYESIITFDQSFATSFPR